VSEQAAPAAIPYGLNVPFIEHLGVRVISQEPGKVVCVLEVKPEHRNSWGVPHGGIVMSLLDFAMGMAGRTSHSTGKGAVTVEMKTSFIAAGEGALTCTGQVTHAGRTLIFCSGEVRDVSGKLCAQALGTFKLLSKKRPEPA
jgi:uncharacterized protein (TIGR00369 family)